MGGRCVFGGPTNYVVGIIFSLRPGKQFRFPLADICRHVCLWPAKNRCFLIYWPGLQTFISHPIVVTIPPAKWLLQLGWGRKTMSAAGRQIKVPTLLVMCFLISNISRVTLPQTGSPCHPAVMLMSWQRALPLLCTLLQIMRDTSPQPHYSQLNRSKKARTPEVWRCARGAFLRGEDGGGSGINKGSRTYTPGQLAWPVYVW